MRGTEIKGDNEKRETDRKRERERKKKEVKIRSSIRNVWSLAISAGVDTCHVSANLFVRPDT